MIDTTTSVIVITSTMTAAIAIYLLLAWLEKRHQRKWSRESLARMMKENA